MITAALSGGLEGVRYERHSVFGLDVPLECAGVPPEVLNPRDTWEDVAKYDAQAQKLAGMFVDNFEAFASGAEEDVRAAGPRVG